MLCASGAVTGLPIDCSTVGFVELAGGDAADHSMLQALCSQRDRFRNKAHELQEDLSAAQTRATTAEAEAAAARADNVALVERLKYVSSYTCVPVHALMASWRPSVLGHSSIVIVAVCFESANFDLRGRAPVSCRTQNFGRAGGVRVMQITMLGYTCS